jgi:hypothetical protein
MNEFPLTFDFVICLLPFRLLSMSSTNSQRGHPYKGNASANPNVRNIKPLPKKVVASDDNLSVKYFIHPHSMHTSGGYSFQRPVEVGSIISESKWPS